MRPFFPLPISMLAVLFSLTTTGWTANQVLTLDGDPESYFEVPDDDSLDLDLGIEFTVEAWVNPEIVDGENMVVNKEDVYEISINNGIFETAIKPLGQGWEWLSSGGEVLEGEWSHIAVTWDGEIVNTFVNGEFMQEFDLFGDEINDSPDTLKVGRRTRGDDTHSIFTGLIDEVRISNIVRYTEDGYELPTAAFMPDENTMALYHFDSESGGVVKDESDNGNDGELLLDSALIPDNFLLPPGDVVTQLQAGDADMDLDFDQLDLVKVQIAAKYLTGQAATWGDGDWNGAPGGQQGEPPAGNGLFDQLDIIGALGPGHYLTGPYGAIGVSGVVGDDQTSVIYDPSNGELSVDPATGKELTSINITSAGGLFTGNRPTVLDGAFDNFAADNLFKATFGGSFGEISFGSVLPAGLTEGDLAGDLTIVGSLLGGGDLGDVDLVVIPEPAAFVLFLLGALGTLIRKRRPQVR